MCWPLKGVADLPAATGKVSPIYLLSSKVSPIYLLSSKVSPIYLLYSKVSPIYLRRRYTPSDARRTIADGRETATG
jgi:hypothetical protein